MLGPQFPFSHLQVLREAQEPSGPLVLSSGKALVQVGTVEPTTLVSVPVAQLTLTRSRVYNVKKHTLILHRSPI